MNTVAYSKCQHCDAEFRGEANPRTVEENAFILLSSHMKTAHVDKIILCPSEPAPGGPFKLGGNTFWRDDNTCSYCGSLSEDAFFAAIEKGCELGPTDKDYKVYVGGQKVGGTGKFYFEHMSEAGKHKFIDLLNAKKINIGAPGRFYVRPFFIAPPQKSVA